MSSSKAVGCGWSMVLFYVIILVGNLGAICHDRWVQRRNILFFVAWEVVWPKKDSCRAGKAIIISHGCGYNFMFSTEWTLTFFSAAADDFIRMFVAS
jgi:hypothetical protein